MDNRSAEWIRSHGLTNLKEEYAEMLRPIMDIEVDIDQQKIAGVKPEAISKEYLNIIKEQNWMIIRLLSDIAAKQ